MPDVPAASTVHDPFRSFKFKVIVGGSTAGFQKVTGLKEFSDLIEYREGEDPVWKRKVPGLTHYDPITFTRGATSNSDLIEWRKLVASTEGKGDGVPGDPLPGFRKDITIQLMDKGAQTVVREWEIKNAWPIELAYSDLNAEGSEIMIETLVLANEGIKVKK